MYQYKAMLKSTKEVIAEGHSVEEIEKKIVRFKRGRKYQEHTRDNEQIEIIHFKRNKTDGIHQSKQELVKIV
ncbi:hypothetical protein NV226_01705 [Mycoplasma iguanae]|uniref:Uncharacterized protein n=1 Tax=Mycoplasma iguanae TaxID=292461 RepID=A0ABY5R7Z6_9MOLU|nr:hypothetical protein [Mycoplasma iguanae]UVD81431.1 hypothetical protein NV226_01705 [Mycoplasma iguanae]